MNRRLSRSFSIPRLILAAGGLVLLAAGAETPQGPMVQVLPQPGKPYGKFVEEQNFCTDQARRSVAGQAARQNERALLGGVAATALGAGLGGAIGGGYGAGVGAASGAVVGGAGGASYSAGGQRPIQRRYDNTYVQCMLSYGNIVPGITAAPPSYGQPQPYYGQPPQQNGGYYGPPSGGQY